MKRIIVFLALFLTLTGIQCKALEITEEENNETLETAELFVVGDSVTAQLSSKKDVDCFMFEVPVDGDITFTFTPHGQDNAIYMYCWNLTVYASDKATVLLSGSLSARSTTNFKVENVKAGMHYLKFNIISNGNPLLNGYSDESFDISNSVSCRVHSTLNDWEDITAPTCNSAGERGQRCSACRSFVVRENVAQLEHSFTEWNILKEAELYERGERKRTCVRCGIVEESKFWHPITMYVVYSVLGGIIVLIIVVKIVRKAKKRKNRYRYSYNNSYSNNYRSSSGNSYSSSYGSNSGSSSSSSSYNDTSYGSSTSSSDYDWDGNFGHAYDFDPSTRNYTDADGNSHTLEDGFVVHDDGTIHIDVSDL